jgi:hypothetical protein
MPCRYIALNVILRNTYWYIDMFAAEHLIRSLLYDEGRVRIQSDNQMLFDDGRCIGHSNISDLKWSLQYLPKYWRLFTMSLL